MAWYAKQYVEKLEQDLAEAKDKLRQYEAIAMERMKIPAPVVPTPVATTTTSQPLNEAETRRVSEILRAGAGGTKWRKFQAKAEAELRNPPAEMTVHTGATA